MASNLAHTISEFSRINEYITHSVQLERLQVSKAKLLIEAIKVLQILMPIRISYELSCTASRHQCDFSCLNDCSGSMQAVQDILWLAHIGTSNFSVGQVSASLIAGAVLHNLHAVLKKEHFPGNIRQHMANKQPCPSSRGTVTNNREYKRWGGSGCPALRS